MGKLKPGWRRVKFGDVVRQMKEKVDPETSGLRRYVAGEHMDSDDLRIRCWGEIGEGYLGPAFHMRFRPGQVLYGSRRTYLRKVAVADFEGICANTTFVLESADPAVLIPELLPFLMSSEAFHEHSKRESKGSVNPYVNFSDLAWYEFALPPLEEQRRLTSLLSAFQSTLTALSEVTAAALAAKDAYAAEVFLLSNPSSCSIGDLCDNITVGIVVKPAQWYVAQGKGVPALLMKNVRRGSLDLSDVTHLSHEGHRLHAKSTLRSGDVVAVRSSGTAGRTGDAAVVPPVLSGANCIDLLVARPSSRLMSEYLCEYLNAPTTRASLIGRSSGTMQKHLNVSAFRELKIPVRPRNEQAAIVEALSSISRAAHKSDRRSTLLRQSYDRVLKTLMGSLHDLH